MKHHKISKVLNDSTVLKFEKIKSVDVNDLLGKQDSINKNIWFKSSMLRSCLCDYSDAYIVLKGTISLTGTDNAKRRNRKVTLKNNISFRRYMPKIYKKFTCNEGDLDIHVLIYNNSYSITSESFWNCYRDK